MDFYIKGDTKYGPWHIMSNIVQKSIFRLIIGNAQGTSFVIATAKNKGMFEAVFITAGHLLDEKKSNNDPLIFDQDGNSIYEEVITSISVTRLEGSAFDTALLEIQSHRPIIPEQDLLAIHKSEDILEKGLQIGWLGYHGFNNPNLKLFRGSIVEYDSEHNRYMLDAAPQPGISGSPAFTQDGRLVGIVTVYKNGYEKYVQDYGQLTLIPLTKFKASLEQDDNTIVL